MKPSDLSEFFSLLGKAKKEKEEEFDNLLKEADINLDDLTSSLVSGIKEAKEDQKKQKKNEEKLIEQLDSIINVIENPKEVKDITEPAVTVGVPEDFDVSKLEEEDALDVQDWNDGKDVKFTEIDAVDIIKPEPIKTPEISDTVAQAIKFIEETNIKEEIENSDETNLDKLKTEIKQVRDILYKVLAHGPGSGEVNLLKLDDVDITDLGDEKVLSYDASSEKLKFVEQSGGSGVSTENVRTGILDVAGIATFRNDTLVGSGITLSPDGDVFVTGITTATKFVGDGSGLTGITASGSGVVVQDEGSAIGTAATINFIGSNVTAALSGGIANVTVTPGITTANVRTGILDVAGIATFRNDTLIGSGITLSPDGDIFATGVTTSSSFVGDLTGDVTGTASNATQLNSQAASYYLDYDNFSNTPTIPSNNNQLTNGAGYITTSFTNTNQLTNGAGFITASDDITGNAATATTLETARTIGGVSFNGSSNIDLPGVNSAGNQNTTGTSAGLTGTPSITVNAVNGTTGTFTAGITTSLRTNKISLGDNERISVGLSSDLSIYHDGDHNIFKASNGFVKFNNNVFQVYNQGGNNIAFEVVPGSYTKLFHGTSNKLQTANTGVVVTGILTATSFEDGNGIGINTANVRTGILDVAGIATFRDHIDVLADSKRLRIGASRDLQIYHGGSNSFIREFTSDLRIQTGSTDVIRCFQSNDSVGLSFGGTQRLETTNTGAKVTGDLEITGALTYEDVTNVDSIGVITARSGVLVGSGITLSPDGDVFATGVTTSTTFVGALTGNVTGNASGSTGTFTTGVTTSLRSNKISLGDSEKIHCGIGSDLEIFHSGNHSFIKDVGTGSLFIASNQFNAYNQAANEKMIVATQNSSVELYHDNTLRLTTSDSGVDVTGSFNVSNIVNIGAASPTTSDNGQLNVYTTTSGGKAQFVHGAGFGGVRLAGTAAASGASLVFSNNYNSGTFSDHWTIQHGGLDDSLKFLIGGTGGTEAFRIESNGKVGISSDSPTAKLDVNGDVRVGSGITLSPDGDIFAVGVSTFNGLVKLPDSSDNQTGRLMFGDGTDLQIFHTGSAGEIGNFTGNLNVKSNSFRIFNGAASQIQLRTDQNDSVILYHSGNEKFKTTNTGAVVTGILTATSFEDGNGIGINTANVRTGILDVAGIATFRDDIKLPDNVKLKIGTHEDIEIYNKGNLSIIANKATGDASNNNSLHIHSYFDITQSSAFSQYFRVGNLVGQENTGGGDPALKLKSGGAVEAYFDGTKRFETASTGAVVTGILTATSNVNVGSGITLSPDGDIFAVGVSTFTDEIHLTTTGNTLRFKDDSGNQLGAIAGNSSNLGFFGNANNNGRFDFYTGGAYRFRIQPGGDINVGTAVTIGGVTGHARYTGIVTAHGGVNVGSGITLSPDGDVFAVGVSTFTELRSNKISVGDNEFINVGLASDFKIHHNGNNTFLDNGEGQLYLRDDQAVNITNLSNQTSANFYPSDGVYLYFVGNQKLRTTNTGITVTGTAVATAFEDSNGIGINTANVRTGILDVAGISTFRDRVQFNSSVGIGTDNPLRNFHVTGTSRFEQLDVVGFATFGSAGTRFFHHTPRIEMPGSNTATLSFVNATTGTTTSDGMLMGFSSSSKVGFINVNESAHGFILKTGGSGVGNERINISGVGTVSLRYGTSEEMVTARPNGAVELYYNGTKRLETTNTGAVVTGILTATTGTFTTGITTSLISNKISVGDDEFINVGLGSDLKIYHDPDGVYNEIKSSNGNIRIRNFDTDGARRAIYIQSEIVQIRSHTNNHAMISATAGAQVDLYYNNTKRLETSDSGAEITGDLEVTNTASGTALKLIDASSKQFVAGGGGGGSPFVGSYTGHNFRIQVGGAQNAIFEYNADEKGIFKLGPASGIGITFNGASGNANFAGITTSITSSVIGSHTSPLTIGAVSSHHLTVANDNASMILGKSNSDALYLRREYATGRYTFQTFNGGSDGSIALQPFGGKVGIASAIPTSTLDVNGDVRVGSGITLSPDGDVFAVGVVTASSFTGDVTGNADTATALETARTIGGTSFDGTANIVPAEATNADTVDSLHASSFLRSDANDSFTGKLTAVSDASNPVIKIQGVGPNFIQFASNASGDVNDDSINLVYRTSTNVLAYERASDDTILFSVDADNAAATFSGALSGTTGTFSGNLSVAQNIVHTGDTDTKIEFVTDTITFDTAGSERLRIDANGNIGVNATPRTDGIADNVDHFLCIGDTDTGIAQDGDGQLELWANNQEIVNLNASTVTFTKTLSIPDTIQHSGDTDTKIRFPSGNVISFETGGTERARFTSNGLCLGGTGSANGLDDYEEGTFTPSYSSSDGNVSGITYDQQSGRYIKIGRLCYIMLRLRTDAISNVGSGLIRISGLPFSHVNSANGRSVSTNVFTANWPGNEAPTQVLVQHNQPYMHLYQKDYNNDTTTLTTSAFGTTTNDNDIRVTAMYETG